MSVRILVTVLMAIAVLAPVLPAAAAEPTDPYLWLEQVDSPRALTWVRAENARTLTVLEQDPRYRELYRQALEIAEAKDRIAYPEQLDGAIFNFWQDSRHVRGIWRRTTLENYRSAAPHWTTVLDVDALAAAEKANWFLQGATCAEPREERCLLSLSEGGEDAVTEREFNLPSMRFVPDGFRLPRGKQRAAWENDSTLLVARAWVPGDLTRSGYPFIVKRLRRGQPAAQAREIFRGTATDGGYGVTPWVLHDGAGNQATLIKRPLSTFESEHYLVSSDRVAKLALPHKSEILSLVAGRLIVSLQEGWTPAGVMYPQGALVAIDLQAARKDPGHLQATLVYAPGPRESFDSAAATRAALVVTTFENVRGRAFLYRPQPEGGWRRTRLDLPDNTSIAIADATWHTDSAFLTVAGFLQPPSLWRVEAEHQELANLKALAPRFDTAQLVVEQFESQSSDGTRIPYFVVHSRQLRLDGANPTILYAYGGFQVSETPYYSGTLGKLWLDRGGVYVLANIRGGGEFGPAWHEAGLKTHRQIIYDDFASVARDLMSRGITSPRRLGIEGGSNGGLLVGVEFTQHPELWNAVDIQVPLLDMLRYEQIAAGTSWVGEFGSVSNPPEAAFLARISPYANLRRGVHYPEAFIWTTTKDDRVGPQHARKFAARLKEFGVPYLFYEVIEGGHGAGANLQERAHTAALEMTYFTRKLMD